MAGHVVSAIVIAGHSHRKALGVARGDRAEAPALLPLDTEDRRFVGLSGSPKQAVYWDRLCAHASGRRLALAWEGNRYNDAFLLQGSPAFDLVVAELAHLPLRDNAVVVPERAVRARFAETGAGLAAFLERLAAHGPARVVLVSAPPPKADAARLAELIGIGAYGAKLAAAHGLDPHDLALTPATVRLKLWQVEQNVQRAVADRFCIAFVPAPAACADADGCLHPDYWAHDVTHANASYGALMRDEIANHFT
ncbi:hypothetical protein ASG60_02865 [Methylobacterium sp. Leaf469]|nr:hypothetical protein ASG60_02865 [Methylobacterium sp. Leaf469]